MEEEDAFNAVSVLTNRASVGMQYGIRIVPSPPAVVGTSTYDSWINISPSSLNFNRLDGEKEID
jgi:hypothetical protein